MARISRHVVRLEREFKLAERLQKEDSHHFVETISFLRLPARLHGEHTLVAFIVRAPGPNYLKELVALGPQYYKEDTTPTGPLSPLTSPDTDGPEWTHSFEKLPLHLFLDFAIGAAECCEILHHGNELVHGEVRLRRPKHGQSISMATN